MKTCSECKSEIPESALRCRHCGVTQSVWKRFVLQWGGVASALLILVTMIQISASLPDKITNGVRFSITEKECSSDKITASITNLETNQFIKLTSARLSLLVSDRFSFAGGGEVREMLIQEEQRYIPPSSKSDFTFNFSPLNLALGNVECVKQCEFSLWLLVGNVDGYQTQSQKISCQVAE